MAIIDVVKYEQKGGEIVHKFPSCGLRWGTQLVVYPGQVAYFAKGGKLFDKFESGTYTLKTNNIPLLNKVINITFGGDSPFQADVWFISLLTNLNLKWGTETPIMLEDPKYKIIVPVRAYGQYGFKVADSQVFMDDFIGNMPDFTEDQLQSYFRGILLTKLTSIITTKIIKDEISILDINARLDDISTYCEEALKPLFLQYGIDIKNFNIISVNIPENDKSIEEIKKAKNLSARLNIVGKDNYKMERTFDVMDSAAQNEGGAGGAFVGTGLGLGAGIGIGQAFNQEMGQIMCQEETPPPLPAATKYYFIINGKQQGPYTTEQIREAISKDSSTLTTLAWKKGLASWQPLGNFVEFKSQDDGENPPPIPGV